MNEQQALALVVVGGIVVLVGLWVSLRNVWHAPVTRRLDAILREMRQRRQP